MTISKKIPIVPCDMEPIRNLHETEPKYTVMRSRWSDVYVSREDLRSYAVHVYAVAHGLRYIIAAHGWIHEMPSGDFSATTDFDTTLATLHDDEDEAKAALLCALTQQLADRVPKLITAHRLSWCRQVACDARLDVERCLTKLADAQIKRDAAETALAKEEEDHE